MSLSNRLSVAALAGIMVIMASGGWLRAQSGAGFPQFFVPVVVDPAAKPLPNPTPTIIKEWGRIGSGRGEFRTPHAMALDSRGRLFVADRGNHRIQIFDQEGNYIDSYYQFSRVSDLFITADDTLYAVDSESDQVRHPNWRTGVRIGRATEDRVTAFIPPHFSDTRSLGVAGEGVAVDRDGNVYVAEGPGSRPAAGGGVTKYVRR